MLWVFRKGRDVAGNIYFRMPTRPISVLRRTAIKRDLILWAAALYLAGFVAGVLVNTLSPYLAETLHSELVDRMAAQYEGITGAISIYSKILIHNLSICVLMTFGGVVFAVPPAFIILVNGLPLGLVLARSEKPILAFVGSVLPHGVFELPAAILAASFGLLLGVDAVRLVWYWMRGEGEAPTRMLLADLRKVLSSFLLVAALLAVAAGVETLLFLLYVGNS